MVIRTTGPPVTLELHLPAIKPDPRANRPAFRPQSYSAEDGLGLHRPRTYHAQPLRLVST